LIERASSRYIDKATSAERRLIASTSQKTDFRQFKLVHRVLG